MRFTELELKPEICKALVEMGYEEMTPIQEQAIPPILEGRDVMSMAETGSGKTAACGVPLVQKTDPGLKAIQTLVIVPTRELAMQYVQEVDRIARNSGVFPFAVFGGFDMGIQKAKLRHGVHFLVATPGRLIDFIWNTRLDLTQVRTLVLDEADEMLKMGFAEDVDLIASCLVHEHQTLLFSATMPEGIERLARTYLKNPVKLELNKEQRAPRSLLHHFWYTGGRRRQALGDYLRKEQIQQAIIFCNSRDKGTALCQDLQREFDSLEFIHGGLEQDRRVSIFNRFRQMKIRLMVATDLAGRGLDFTHATHVINYDFPLSPEIYTHRTGRTGRMGRTGTALTLVTDRDLHKLQHLLRVNGIDPVWQGEAPDMAGAAHAAPAGHSGGRRLPRRPPGRRSRSLAAPKRG